MQISVVIPVHNEEGNIISLVNEILTLPIKDIVQIIVVDDASNDKTVDVLFDKQKTTPKLNILTHLNNYGQSAAISTGIAHAMGTLIITLDGDGQNDPADIPNLIDTIKSDDNYQMVAGYRKKRHDTTWRIISSKIANKVRRFFLNDDTPDTGCGLKIFYKSTFVAMPFFNHMHRFLPALVQMQGGNVTSVVVNHRPREHGTSNYDTLGRLRVGIIDLFGVRWLRQRSKTIILREHTND